MKLSYWVFTSSEKGIHGLDCGIKFASESFTDKYALDVEYLPGIDHGGRLNTSSVIALIPRELPAKIAVNEFLERIYCENDIPNIARKNSDARPDFLTLGENLTGKFPAFPENLRWPRRNEGYISVDGDLERLKITEESEVGDVESDSHSKSKTGVIIAGVAVMAVVAGRFFMFIGSDTPPKIDTPSQNQTVESQSFVISHDAQNQIAASKQEESKPNEPEKNIMEGIIAELENYEGTKNFMTAKSLVSFDISASRRSLPEALIDKDGITQTLMNLFGNINPETTKEKKGFMLRVLRADEKKLPLEVWRTKKAEIFTVITPESVSPAKSLQHDRLINSLKSSDVKEGWLTLYFMTSCENVRLAVFVNISGNVNPFLRLESESDGLIPVSEAADLSAKISETETPSGYRIIFSVPEKFMEGTNDFNTRISAYIQQFSEEEY